MFDYIGVEVVPEGEFAGDHGAADVGVCGDFLEVAPGFQLFFPAGDFMEQVVSDFSTFFIHGSFADVVAFEYEGSNNHLFAFVVGIVQSEAYPKDWGEEYLLRG